ncbi:UNVERIFIED_CONTAM: hypothetical protein Slati_2213200 [Sesamum latifolium]|uniref:Uncharacterized protein n=1 Tax=Sesamum latifolium TaxID=2727402 RepID=A0AAW2WTX1_9LAMI
MSLPLGSPAIMDGPPTTCGLESTTDLFPSLPPTLPKDRFAATRGEREFETTGVEPAVGVVACSKRPVQGPAAVEVASPAAGGSRFRLLWRSLFWNKHMNCRCRGSQHGRAFRSSMAQTLTSCTFRREPLILHIHLARDLPPIIPRDHNHNMLRKFR